MVGLSVRNRDALPSATICPQCSLLLRDPVQLIDCGHRMCQSCVDEQQGDVVICAACRQRVLRVNLQLDRGFRNDMQLLEVLCALCDWTGDLKKYQEHLQNVHPNPGCMYCEGQFLSVDALNRHQQYDCQKITVDCPFRQFGCEGAILRIKLNEHFRSAEHQLILTDIVRRWKSIQEPADGATFTATVHYNAENAANQLAEIEETTNVLSNSMLILTDDVQRLSTDSVQLQTVVDHFSADVNAVKTSIQEQNTSVDGMVVIQDATQHDLESIQGEVSHMSSVSHDGTFTWKIDDVSTKTADAQKGKQLYIDSPVFYTSATGYKMCLRLLMNGDGSARGTHLSLFLVLMRGDFDAILQFPFLFQVIFCLYDQTEQKNHIIDAFRPDPASSSSQRPQADKSTPSGITKFVPLAQIEQHNSPYVHGNSMFIKAMVDFNDTPKALLSYALSLNPGFADSVQRTMIRQKLEQKERQ